MKLSACFKALGRAHTYNVKGNACLRTGILLGLLVSLLFAAGVGLRPWEFRWAASFLILLVHPLLIGVLFGAMGTIQLELHRLHEGEKAHLSGLAMTDPLTGLYNRRYVEGELRNLLLRSERTGAPVSVVFFDLDHFKEVNLRQGHRGGDRMLKMVAQALQTVLRHGETLGRYGGDEFLLVVAADLPYATHLVDRAVAAVNVWTRLSVSAGIARSKDDGSTSEELIAAADARLAKVQEQHHAEQRLSRSSRV